MNSYCPVMCDSSFVLFKHDYDILMSGALKQYCEVFSGNNTLLYVFYTGCQVLSLQRITHVRGIMLRLAYHLLARCCFLQNGK